MDVATLIYTSGTTGNPKEVETTHTSLLSEVFSGLDQVLGLQYGDLGLQYGDRSPRSCQPRTSPTD